MIRNNSRSDSNYLLSTTFRKVLLATSFIVTITTATHAADVVAPPPVQTEFQDQQRWHVIFSPYVWGASLNGSAGLLGMNTNVDVPFREILDNLDVSLMGNVEITNGTFGAYVDGQYTKTSQGADVRGEQLDMDIKSTTVSGGVYYRIYEQKLDGTTLFGKQRVFAIEPTVGLRWTELNARVNIGPYSESRKADWTDPFIGTRFFYDINDRWNIFAEADIGGFGAGTKLSANGQIYLGYRTLIFDVPTTWRVGYRALYQDYRDNDGVEKFKYDVTQHGPVIGLSVQF